MWRPRSCLPRLVIVAAMGIAGCGQALPLNSPTATGLPVLGSASAAVTTGTLSAIAATASVSGSPASLPAPPTVAEVYQRAGQALDRPGLLYRATIRAENDGPRGRGSVATTRWVDARYQVAREELVTQTEQPPSSETRTVLVTAGGRYTRSAPELPVSAVSPPACHGATVGAVAALGCPPDPLFALSTTAVEEGEYAGRPAVVLVLAETLTGRAEYAGTLTTRLYLDPATCLPLGADAAGQITADGPQRELRPVWIRAAYAHAFIPADAVPTGFFEPASLGYVAPGDDIARPVPGFPDFRAYWLGERFAGAGTLPPLAVGQVEGGADTGYIFTIFYGGAAAPFGRPLVRLEEWPRAAWDALPPAARPIPPCSTQEEIALPAGRATIFMRVAPEAGPGRPPRPPDPGACPTGPVETFLAHAYLGATVVVVIVDSGPGDGDLDHYNSRAGIEVVLRALQPAAVAAPPLPGLPNTGAGPPAWRGHRWARSSPSSTTSTASGTPRRSTSVSARWRGKTRAPQSNIAR